MPENTAQLLTTFNFRVTLRRSPDAAAGASGTAQAAAAAPPGQPLGEGGFQECTGLEVEQDVQTLEEGGRNDGVIRRVGRGKYQNLILKRGMFVSGAQANRDLWSWLQGVLAGTRPVVRYDGTVEVLDNQGNRLESAAVVLATWTFERGLPSKVLGPQLNAKTGEIAMEELHIAHEGLRLKLE